MPGWRTGQNGKNRRAWETHDPDTQPNPACGLGLCQQQKNNTLPKKPAPRKCEPSLSSSWQHCPSNLSRSSKPRSLLSVHLSSQGIKPPAWCHLPGEFSIALKFILKTLLLRKEEPGMVVEYLPSMPEALGFSAQHGTPPLW